MPIISILAMPTLPMLHALALTLLLGSAVATAATDAAACGTAPLPGVGGKHVKSWRLTDGSVAAFSGMNINIDGYAKAYHPNNREAGAVLHLCVGARIWLPDGSFYEGSNPPANCTGKFMADLARIAAAGWQDPAVGVVEWYGVAAEGSVKMAGRTIRSVKPLLQKDGSGFYVSHVYPRCRRSDFDFDSCPCGFVVHVQSLDYAYNSCHSYGCVVGDILDPMTPLRACFAAHGRTHQTIGHHFH